MGKDEFIAELRKLRQECGCPPYRRLTRVSRDLARYYQPSGDVRCTLAPLSLTAVSEVLAGRRKRLPTFDWVASYVLSCQRWAHQNHAISDDPGISALPRWAALLARHTAGAEPLPAGPGADAVPAGRMSPDQRDFIASHGPYGLVLLAQVGRGDPDGLYRVAVLMGADPARGNDALGFLLAAAAAGSTAAIDLLDGNPSELPAGEAARTALELAREAQARGALDEAIAFYRAAACGDIPDAVIEHARVVLAEHGHEEAAKRLAALITQPSIGRHRASQT